MVADVFTLRNLHLEAEPTVSQIRPEAEAAAAQ
jgi:hypothetical protein